MGVVTTSDDEAALGEASVWIVGTNLGALTSADGLFTIAGVPVGPQVVRANRIGLADATVHVDVVEGQTVRLEITMSTSPVRVDGISVSGSRRIEKVTDAPVSLSILSGEQLSRSAELSYVEVLERMRGVDSYRTGIANVTPNARGFTSGLNYRFRVLVDHRMAHVPTIGTPAGFAYPVMSEDIERMEAILGPSSALYGPNAHNGLLHIITKHPREYPGTSVTLGVGTNSTLSGRVRHAGAFDRFAYKVNAEYLSGDDWIKDDTVAIDDFGQVYTESADNAVESIRATASIYYFPSSDVQIIGTAGRAMTDALITTNTTRNQVTDFTLDFQQLRVESPRFFAQAYRTGNDNGRSHAIETKVAAQVASANAGAPISEEEAISQVRLIENGYRLNYEAQANDRFDLGAVGIRWIVGAQHEDIRPNSQGTLFAEGRANLDDPSTGAFQVRQTGVYGQAEFELDEHWRIIAAGRYDRHDLYESQASPRFAIAYRLPDAGSFRITYNRAFQAPEVLATDLLAPAGVIPGTSIPIVVYGNGYGFELSDGSVIAPLSPERNTTYEVGYKGMLGGRLFVDVNAYQSRYENFQSPATAITNPGAGVVPVTWGDSPIDLFPAQYVLSYRSFGKVRVDGIDVGLTYRFSDRVEGWTNYSHMNVVGLDDPANDFDEDGDFDELSFNSPENKATFGVRFSDLVASGLNVGVHGRWVESYDFVAGFHRATAAGEGTGQFQFKDRGPLGDFTTFDISLSYPLTTSAQVSLSATNLFDESLRESIGSPSIRRMIRTEVSYAVR
jgi:iron complex outermembrane receptor protein